MLAIALASRLWHLGSVPTVFFHDECDNTANAIEILQGKGPRIWGFDWKGQPALAVHLIALSLEALGPGITAVRLPSALVSVLALVPFYLLARRFVDSAVALAATLLLALDLCYLHFSRSGWENVQICFFTLVAMEAVSRAEEGKRVVWWGLAGLAAAVAAYVYFAGELVIVFLLLYVLLLLRARERRAAVVKGMAVMAATFLLAVVPLLLTLHSEWGRFNSRTREVFIARELPADAGAAAVVGAALRNGVRSAQTVLNGTVNNLPRYYPVNRPLLGWMCGLLLVAGLVASLGLPRPPILWWLALIVPFVFTQMLTTQTPNLARGIGLLPIVYLFIALGMQVVIEIVGSRWQPFVRGVLVLLVVVTAGRSLKNYFDWATSPELTTMLDPAVQRSAFTDWWDAQNQRIYEGHGPFNTMMWQAWHSGEPPAEVQDAAAAGRSP